MKKRIISICVLVALCLALLPTAAVADGKPLDGGTLTVATSLLNGKFSPFFFETAYDQDVWALTQVSLLSTDRAGAFIAHGIDGETVNYNGADYTYYSLSDLSVTQNADGSVDYDFTLRNDVVFSDGVPLTVDDVIFSMYVFSDPMYDGISSFSSLPIEGMEEYRAGFDTLGNIIYAAGPEVYQANDYYTETQYVQFWNYYNNQAGIDLAQEVIDYCVTNYAQTYGMAYTGHTYEEIIANTDYQVQLGMAIWGYAEEYFEGATAEDYWNIMVARYNGDAATAEYTESVKRTRLQFTIESDTSFQQTVITGISAPNITGIQKTGPNSLRIRLSYYDVSAIYSLGVAVAPMHYYGSEALYDYDANMFGFPKGDLSSVRSKTSQPMGAGPYKFVSYENGQVTFEYNESYYLGTPKIANVVFQETSYDDLVRGVVSGEYDVAEPSFTDQAIDEIKDFNRNGELTGNRITTIAVDNMGYGYIGISAVNVSVGGEPASAASKNLRKALATALSLFRDEGVASYYGDKATVINYPISNTSWAAPHPEEPGYEIAFSKDVNGSPIYTSDMNAEEKKAAAKTAVLGFLEAAGYSVQDGQAVAAPDGARLEYSITIPGGGHGDHPAYTVAVSARDLLAEVGMTLTVNDLADSSQLWDGLYQSALDMWCAAWGSAIDPDMYQIYHSSNVPGLPGSTGSNHYHIQDAQLDQLIMEGRSSSDQTVRKTIYKNCLDIILDWAVEMPYYQRQNAYIFSTKRVNMDTVPTMTTLYGWTSEIQNIELLPFTGYELTLAGSESSSEKPVTVTGVVDAGEYTGVQNFTVACEEPCMVLCSRDWGESYERLPQIATRDGHSFTVNFDGELTIAVVKIGDIMLDGSVNTTDVTQMKRIVAGKRDYTALQFFAADVTGDGRVNMTDVNQLKRFIAGKRTFEW